MTLQEENIRNCEPEVFAIEEALEKFKKYLLGLKVKSISDFGASQKTMFERDLEPKVARWALHFEENRKSYS